MLDDEIDPIVDIDRQYVKVRQRFFPIFDLEAIDRLIIGEKQRVKKQDDSFAHRDKSVVYISFFVQLFQFS